MTSVNSISSLYHGASSISDGIFFYSFFLLSDQVCCVSNDRYDVQGGDEEEASATREEEMKIEIDLLKGEEEE